ncbi:paraquat-inducible protein B [Salipiger aestuarii]|uniref:Paraquat-inducible protein B n=1 Tax=Salipiger aestuarii TaxID=568098 RepID=A0A327YE80_9RHOB|nr:MlaD family protein [Salipiger aestuarii]EIE51878.1 paraquat-inducible protein B [Citreicella sp. 357]KAA8608315.1 paraquat-inducible protein B [Salipiger aestuarii]KAB2542218.1 paraquat-inducible protein B [Salipiger aestuarii]RAK16809.1 paraquat-inducible protein B [Salipiger aestuarii]
MAEPQPAQMKVEGPKRSFWRNLSLAWLVPIGALAVTLGVAWQSYNERGTLIEIRFENAAGVVPEETTIRYRDVTVGMVEKIEFSSDLSSVVVTASIDDLVAEGLTRDAQFWVVRPEVSASGISGLSTVLSGVYIEAGFVPQTDTGTSAAESTTFEGLDTPPLVKPGMKGTRIVLRAATGTQLSAGAPIFHQGIEVGRIETPRLIDSGNGVIADAFIDAPYDKRLTTATRFWDTSGFNVSFGAAGFNFSVESLSTLIRGGVAFGTVFSGGEPVPSRYVFDLFDDSEAARDSVYSDLTDNAVTLTIAFDQSVSGLTVGSPVTFSGLKIGQVQALGAFIDDVDGEQEVKLRASVSIDPRAFGLDPDTPQEDTLGFLGDKVRDGLRARLASEGLFSTGLMIELIELPIGQPTASFDPDDPQIPSVESNIDDLTTTAQGVLTRIDNLPIEEMIEQITATLGSIERLVGNEEMQQVPGSVNGLLTDARGLIGSEGFQTLPDELSATVGELRTIAEDLRTADLVGTLTRALDSAANAADTVNAMAGDLEGAASEIPGLVAEARALVKKANTLPLEAFVNRASDLLDSADRLIDSEDARALPGALTRAFDEAQRALAELRQGGVVENANATLASARDAAAAIEEAAQTLPALSRRIGSLVGQAETTIGGYADNSEFNRETVSALREVREAAEALTKLARQIERNPNSLLFGR